MLPCLESMAQANRILSLRAAEQLTVLPPALLSTLPFRVQSDHPDVIVLAASIANLTYRAAVREVFEETPTLLLAEEPSTALVRDAARLHIYSVLQFDVSAQQLVAAISATVAGFAVTLPRLPAGVPEVAPGVEHLTAREVEILRLMARGQRNKQVAAQLNISQHTVKYHVSAVMAKLGARTRTEAVTIGVTRGLVAI